EPRTDEARQAPLELAPQPQVAGEDAGVDASIPGLTAHDGVDQALRLLDLVHAPAQAELERAVRPGRGVIAPRAIAGLDAERARAIALLDQIALARDVGQRLRVLDEASEVLLQAEV